MIKRQLTVGVVSEGYPTPENPYSMAFVHSRVLAYLNLGVKVDVFSFSTARCYNYEGVDVFPAKGAALHKYMAVVSHAPNIRHHLPLLIRSAPKRLFLVFHGHEVLNTRRYYPLPYTKLRPANHLLRHAAVALYDSLKLKLMRAYICNRLAKNETKLIFVSDWMKRAFVENLNIPEQAIHGNSIVIPNPVNEQFLRRRFNSSAKKVGDFITIRPFDEPKYAVDLVVRLADANPDCSFHLFGRGRYFNHYTAPANIHIQNRFLSQPEIPDVLDSYTAAVMPTRLDSQGVMMCEMATYGIPIITSDIPICREMLAGFSNAMFLNDYSEQTLRERVRQIEYGKEVPRRFYPEETVLKEANYLADTLK